ncbi:MAG: tRNA dihydrouridine synthase DusB [Actinomycetota bacterium]
MKKRMRALVAARSREPVAPPSDSGPWPLAEPFRVAQVELPNRVVQAPLAGIGNRVFREQSRRYGAGLVVSEMVAAHGIRHGNRRTQTMLELGEGESPVAIQVFGGDPDVMAEAARAVQDAGADMVDINMGCPVPKIMKTGAGAALLDDPSKGEAVVRAMADAVTIPVTVKMRRGVRPGDIDPGEVARRFEAAGAALITIHPRAAVEEYSGTADHRISAEVVRAVDIPVVISGDIANAAEARDALEMTGAAGVMIGRAGLGNPWLLGAIARGEADPRPSRDQVIDELTGFSEGIAQLIGAERACHYLRKFHSWYLAGRGIPDAEIQALMEAPTFDEAMALLAALREG